MRLNKKSRFTVLLISFIVITSSFSFIISSMSKESIQETSPIEADNNLEYQKCGDQTRVMNSARWATYIKNGSVYLLDLNDGSIETELVATAETPIKAYIGGLDNIIYAYFKGGEETRKIIADKYTAINFPDIGNTLVTKNIETGEEKEIFSTDYDTHSISSISEYYPNIPNLESRFVFITISDGSIYSYEIETEKLSLIHPGEPYYRLSVDTVLDATSGYINNEVNIRDLLLKRVSYEGSIYESTIYQIYNLSTKQTTLLSTQDKSINPIYYKFGDYGQIYGYRFTDESRDRPSKHLKANKFGAIIEEIDEKAKIGYNSSVNLPLLGVKMIDGKYSILQCRYNKDKKVREEIILDDVDSIEDLKTYPEPYDDFGY